MGHVFHRQLARAIPRAVRGDGVYVFDDEGKQYIDGYAGGAAVSCLGHSHPAVIEAVREQIGRLPYLHGAMFTNEPMEALSDVLTADAPAGCRCSTASNASRCSR